MAGINFLCVRSPDAPKMTSAHGSGARRSMSPASSGFACTGVSVVAIDGLDRVSAELVAQRGVDLGGEVELVARREPRIQRGGDDRGRHALGDRLLDRP